MYYITVNFLRFGWTVDTMEEAIEKFENACRQYPNDYIAIRDNAGFAIKERF